MPPEIIRIERARPIFDLREKLPKTDTFTKTNSPGTPLDADYLVVFLPSGKSCFFTNAILLPDSGQLSY